MKKWIAAGLISGGMLLLVFVGTKLLMRVLFPDFVSTHYKITEIVR